MTSSWQKFLDLATASAVAPPAPAADTTTLPEPVLVEGDPAGTTAKVTRTTTTPSTNSGFPNWMLWLAIVLWFVACVAGTFGSSISSLPHEAFIQLDGQPVAACSVMNPAAVEGDPDVASQWCTPDDVLGATLPDDVTFVQGDVDWQEVDWDDLANVFGAADMWLTLGLGLVGLIFLVGFSKVSGTLRAGLAAAISVTFMGLLLFPVAFTSRIPADMRGELVTAWQWVIAFYFGSEAAVQAVKVLRPAGSTAGGDLTGAGAVTTTMSSEVTRPPLAE
jgi:hypothetical protein